MSPTRTCGVWPQVTLSPNSCCPDTDAHWCFPALHCTVRHAGAGLILLSRYQIFLNLLTLSDGNGNFSLFLSYWLFSETECCLHNHKNKIFPLFSIVYCFTILSCLNSGRWQQWTWPPNMLGSASLLTRCHFDRYY